jgi:hypothetical protein
MARTTASPKQLGGVVLFDAPGGYPPSDRRRRFFLHFLDFFPIEDDYF